MNTTQIAFTEGRQNAINGFGSTDGFISIDNLDFENCLTLKLNLKLSPLNSTNTTFFPSTNNLATPTPSILNANSPTYNQKMFVLLFVMFVLKFNQAIAELSSSFLLPIKLEP